MELDEATVRVVIYKAILDEWLARAEAGIQADAQGHAEAITEAIMRALPDPSARTGFLYARGWNDASERIARALDVGPQPVWDANDPNRGHAIRLHLARIARGNKMMETDGAES